MCYVMCCASFIYSVCYASFSILLYSATEHEEGATPELLDALVDKRHRSYMSAVRGTSLGTFRARVPMSTMPIDPRWVPRYGLNMPHILIISLNVSCYLINFFPSCRLHASGLLPIARLVEGDVADPRRPLRDKAACFQFDMSLLAALLDHWRPETHTFHLTVGEMTPTLQDVAMLLGLPWAGLAVGTQDVPVMVSNASIDRFLSLM